MKTITRADVAETIYEEVGLSRKDSSDIKSSYHHSVLFHCVLKKQEPGAIQRPESPQRFHLAA